MKALVERGGDDQVLAQDVLRIFGDPKARFVNQAARVEGALKIVGKHRLSLGLRVELRGGELVRRGILARQNGGHRRHGEGGDRCFGLPRLRQTEPVSAQESDP